MERLGKPNLLRWRRGTMDSLRVCPGGIFSRAQPHLPTSVHPCTPRGWLTIMGINPPTYPPAQNLPKIGWLKAWPLTPSNEGPVA